MDRELFDAAKAVRERAHAPYSNFHVGAALRTEAGTVHAGANVENASYPGRLVRRDLGDRPHGRRRRRRARAAASPRSAVVADAIDGRLTTPCGGCRQRLAEFAGPDTPVHVIDPTGDGADLHHARAAARRLRAGRTQR